MATSGSFATGSYTDSGITRYLLFSWERTAYSIAENTSTIAWSLTGAGSSGWMMCGGFTVVIDGETVYSKPTDYRVQVYSGTVIASGTKTINHNTDGSRSFSASASAGIYSYAVNKSGSGAWSLDNIPRQATLTNAPNFNDEENPTITYSNPAGNSVDALYACISLDGLADDIPYREIPKTGNSYTFMLTESERSILRYNTLNGSTSRTVVFFVATSIGGQMYRSTLSKTFSVINCTPEISASIRDVGAASVPLTGNDSVLIKGFNYVIATMGNTLYKGATIREQTIRNGNRTLYGITGGADSMEVGLDSVESGEFVFTLTDSRGLTVSKTVTAAVVEYIKLTCNLTASAPTTSGTATLKIAGNCFSGSFGAVDNYLAVEYRIKENNADWGAWALVEGEYSLNGNQYSVEVNLPGLNYQSGYTFQARAQDRVTTIESEEVKVKTTPLFDWSEENFNFNVPVSFSAGIVPTPQKVLWDGVAFMTAGQSISLPENISRQVSGVILAWCGYNANAGEPYNDDWHYMFIPKCHTALQNGTAVTSGLIATADSVLFGSKCVYVTDTTVTGNDSNIFGGTRNGVNLANAYWVLRYIIGV